MDSLLDSSLGKDFEFAFCLDCMPNSFGTIRSTDLDVGLDCWMDLVSLDENEANKSIALDFGFVSWQEFALTPSQLDFGLAEISSGLAFLVRLGGDILVLIASSSLLELTLALGLAGRK